MSRPTIPFRVFKMLIFVTVLMFVVESCSNKRAQYRKFGKPKKDCLGCPTFKKR